MSRAGWVFTIIGIMWLLFILFVIIFVDGCKKAKPPEENKEQKPVIKPSLTYDVNKSHAYGILYMMYNDFERPIPILEGQFQYYQTRGITGKKPWAVLMDLGYCYTQLGRFEEANDMYRRASMVEVNQ